MKNQFTFKTVHPTGKWRSFEPDQHIIKLNKKEVGRIDCDPPHKIRLMVVKKDINEDKNPNCTWKWITLKQPFKSLAEAKEFANEKFLSIVNQFTLHSFEN